MHPCSKLTYYIQIVTKTDLGERANYVLQLLIREEEIYMEDVKLRWSLFLFV